MMNQLPDELIEKVSQAITACDPFADPAKVHELFNDERLLPWIFNIESFRDAPAGDLIAFLLENPIDPSQPLLYFLAALAEIHPAGTECRHRLVELIYELADFWAIDPYPVLRELAGPMLMAGEALPPIPEMEPPELGPPQSVPPAGGRIPPPPPPPPMPVGSADDVAILPPDESAVKRLRLDVAVPNQVTCGEPFQLAATIREIAAPLLVVEVLPQVSHGDVVLYWPAGTPIMRLRLQVRAQNCEINKDEEIIQLIPGAPVPVIYFDLIPREVGVVKLRVVLYQEEAWLGNADIETKALDQPAGEVRTNVVSIVPTSPTYIQIREVLMQCAPLQSDEDVYHLFSDERLYPWRNLAPDGLNVQERAEALIALLREKQDTAGRNAMGLLLLVAADLLDPQDGCHTKLMELARELLPAD